MCSSFYLSFPGNPLAHCLFVQCIRCSRYFLPVGVGRAFHLSVTIKSYKIMKEEDKE